MYDTRTHQGIKRDTETQAWDLFNLVPPLLSDTSSLHPVSSPSPPPCRLRLSAPPPVQPAPSGLEVVLSLFCQNTLSPISSLQDRLCFARLRLIAASSMKPPLDPSPTSSSLAFCLHIFVFLFLFFLSFFGLLFFVLFICFFASPHGMRDFSSLTRDQTCNSGVGSAESEPLDHQGSVPPTPRSVLCLSPAGPFPGHALSFQLETTPQVTGPRTRAIQ